MNNEDLDLQSARLKLDTVEMFCNFASYQHEISLRKSWNKGVGEFFNDHPSVSEFTWRQFSQKEGGFYCDPHKVQIDGLCFRDVDEPDQKEEYAAYKDAVELLGFYKGSELRKLFGNFVEVTVRRDDLVQFRLTEESDSVV